jgi:arylsulfatase A-like enzyme
MAGALDELVSMQRARFSTLVALAGSGVLLALVAAGCRSTPPATPIDNILLVTLDTTRADRMGAYGYEKAATPAFDALARTGTLFEQARAHVASTLPSHTSLMTGRLPPSHGVRSNGLFRVPAEETTLAEILTANGFETGAVLAAFPLERRFGLAAGFASWDDDFAADPADRAPVSLILEGEWFGNPVARFERRADVVTDKALAWLEGRQGRWFLFAHYFDAHWPYKPPVGGEAFRDPYDGELAWVDSQLARLLERVRAMPGRTLVVVTADHGEGLREHGEGAHSMKIYDTTQRVPLVFALDGRVAAGKRVKLSVGLVDVMPTILDLAGIEIPAGLDGRSLAPLLAPGDATLAELPVYLESLVARFEVERDDETRGLVAGGHKLIARTRAGKRSVELYDLLADPRELDNLAARDTERLEELESILGAWSEALEQQGRRREPVNLDPEAESQLKALGYL